MKFFNFKPRVYIALCLTLALVIGFTIFGSNSSLFKGSLFESADYSFCSSENSSANYDITITAQLRAGVQIIDHDLSQFPLQSMPTGSHAKLCVQIPTGTYTLDKFTGDMDVNPDNLVDSRSLINVSLLAEKLREIRPNASKYSIYVIGRNNSDDERPVVKVATGKGSQWKALLSYATICETTESNWQMGGAVNTVRSECPLIQTGSAPVVVNALDELVVKGIRFEGEDGGMASVDHAIKFNNLIDPINSAARFKNSDLVLEDNEFVNFQYNPVYVKRANRLAVLKNDFIKNIQNANNNSCAAGDTDYSCFDLLHVSGATNVLVDDNFFMLKRPPSRCVVHLKEDRMKFVAPIIRNNIVTVHGDGVNSSAFCLTYLDSVHGMDRQVKTNSNFVTELDGGNVEKNVLIDNNSSGSFNVFLESFLDVFAGGYGDGFFFLDKNGAEVSLIGTVFRQDATSFSQYHFLRSPYGPPGTGSGLTFVNYDGGIFNPADALATPTDRTKYKLTRSGFVDANKRDAAYFNKIGNVDLWISTAISAPNFYFDNFYGLNDEGMRFPGPYVPPSFFVIDTQVYIDFTPGVFDGLLGSGTPAITNFSPTHAEPFELVRITGSNFNKLKNTGTAPNVVVVYFGDVRHFGDIKSDTEVEVAVPLSANTGKLKLVKLENGQDTSVTAISAADFTVDLNYTISPATSSVGQILTINGAGLYRFTHHDEKIRVKFPRASGGPVTVMSSVVDAPSGSSATVTVPSGAVSGALTFVLDDRTEFDPRLSFVLAGTPAATAPTVTISAPVDGSIISASGGATPSTTLSVSTDSPAKCFASGNVPGRDRVWSAMSAVGTPVNQEFQLGMRLVTSAAPQVPVRSYAVKCTTDLAATATGGVITMHPTALMSSEVLTSFTVTGDVASGSFSITSLKINGVSVTLPTAPSATVAVTSNYTTPAAPTSLPVEVITSDPAVCKINAANSFDGNSGRELSAVVGSTNGYSGSFIQLQSGANVRYLLCQKTGATQAVGPITINLNLVSSSAPDTTAPVLAPPTAALSGGSLVLGVTATDTGGGVASCKYSTTSGFAYDTAGTAMTNTTGTNNWGATLTTVPTVATTYYFKCKDTAGNTSAESTVTFNPAPANPSLLTPASGATDVSLRPTFTWEPATAATQYSLMISTDATIDTTDTVYTIPARTTTYTLTSDLLNSTTYYWKVVATNSGGAYNYTQRSFTTLARAVTGADTTAPALSAGLSYVSGANLKIRVTATDLVGVTACHADVSTDAAWPTTSNMQRVGTTDNWIGTIATLPTAATTYRVRCKDAAGNIGTLTSGVTFTPGFTPTVVRPVGTLPVNTSSTDLLVNNDRYAECKLGTAPDFSMDSTTAISLANLVGATAAPYGSTYTFAGLINGNSYSYFVKCRTGAAGSYTVSNTVEVPFAVASSGGVDNSTYLDVAADSEVLRGEPADISIKLGAKDYIAVIANIVGNNYAKTIYFYCHTSYTANCPSKSDTKLSGSRTISVNWDTYGVNPGNYEVRVTARVSDNEMYKDDTEDIDVVLSGSGSGDCERYFADMRRGDKLCEEVSYLRKEGIFMGQEVKGKRIANLNANMSRSEYFAVATRLYGSADDRVGDYRELLRFRDVTPAMISNRNNEWWMDSILQLDGIVKGYADGSLRPTQKITMAELAKVTALSTGFISFYDEGRNPWYADIVDAYRYEGINFSGNAMARRGDAVKLIYDTLMLDNDFRR